MSRPGCSLGARLPGSLEVRLAKSSAVKKTAAKPGRKGARPQLALFEPPERPAMHERPASHERPAMAARTARGIAKATPAARSPKAGPKAIPAAVSTPVPKPVPRPSLADKLPPPEPVATPVPKEPRRATAEALAQKQREISVSEFFVKNRHLLGFDNPSKALLTT